MSQTSHKTSQQSSHQFAAAHYSERAKDYLTSVNHSAGPDLDQIEALLRDRPDARVLDLGCGGGHVTYRAAPLVREVVACDLTPSMLEVVAQAAAERGLTNVTTQQAAAEQLPFASGAFDVVLCRLTAHHWHDFEAGLREARRVLDPGGLAVFIDGVAPEDPALDTHLQAIELLRDVSHVRNYRILEWTAALARSGFDIRRMNTHKLRLTFPVWIARTRTSPEHAIAIRSLQIGAPASVREHFGVDDDGCFDLDMATIVVEAAIGREA